MKRMPTLLLCLVIIIGLWMLYGYMSVRNIEEPRYTVIDPKSDSAIAQANNIELRKYDVMIVAEATVPGPYDEAINNGFRLVADYIFGNNTKEASIAMTAPVVQEEKDSTKIAMTIPVLQEEQEDSQFTIGFVMPSEYSMQTIPKPNNPAVTLREIADHTLGVITFSGLWTDAKAEKHTQALRKALQDDGYTITSSPQYARYNPPWTPPWMRRNEIWLEVKE